MQRFGLKEKTHDERDIHTGALFKPVSETLLPDAFELEIPSSWILTQAFDDCAGHASSLASSYQEGLRLDPKFTWMMARHIKGLTEADYGIELRDMMDTHVKIGAIALTDSPFNEYDDRWKDITNWDVDSMLSKSVYYKKGSYVSITPMIGMDMYDTIRYHLYLNKTPIVIGLRWAYGLSADMPTWIDGGDGHAVVISGWKKDSFMLQKIEREIINNSWGISAGQQGKFYVCRDIINRETPRFGAMFFIDEDPDKLREYIAQGIKIDDISLNNILKDMFKKIIDLALQILNLKKRTMNTKLQLWAQAIKEHEGWSVGSHSYRNNNPGNFKYSTSGYLSKYGLVKKDAGDFAIFPTYDQGWLYLVNSLKNWATTGNSLYKPTMTLLQFFHVYAPTSDNNDPNAYANAVAQKIGVPTSTQIKDLLV